jgi:DNA-3-methyladenine glycosylase II
MEGLGSPFESLAESIVYQQLTGKAAATIFSRVKALYGGSLSAEKIIATPDEHLRAAGLSGSKTAALKDLAQKQKAGLVPSERELSRMTDEEIVEHLIVIRGIGKWTVEMLLIFRLGRPDVLPIHDYGVRKGFALTYGRAELPKPKELEEFGERWRPYRTVASWYLWRSLDRPKSGSD